LGKQELRRMNEYSGVGWISHAKGYVVKVGCLSCRERLRVAAASDVAIATLRERMSAEVEQCRGIVIGRAQGLSA
jgi:hypothetical protein